VLFGKHKYHNTTDPPASLSGTTLLTLTAWTGEDDYSRK